MTRPDGGMRLAEQFLVFISHTSEMRRGPSGESFVAAAEEAINTVDGAKARHMEQFHAEDRSPAEASVAQLREADIFVAIVGFDRGSIVRGEQRSYTELEFDAATDLGKRRLVFLLDPALAPTNRVDPHQQRFRQRLEQSGLLVRYFSDVNGLKYELHRAVAKAVEDGQMRRARGAPTRPADRPADRISPRLPADRPHAPTGGRGPAVVTGLLGVLLVAAVGLGIWSAIAGNVPPWEPPGPCGEVAAAVVEVRTSTFGPFVEGSVLEIVVDNQSDRTITLPAARDVTARGADGDQYAPQTSLADESWFFGVEIQPLSRVTLELGLASGGAGSDVVTVTIPDVRGTGPPMSRCSVTLEPVNVTFAG